jgi:predicted RNA polymerase sigma factor
MRFIRRGTTAAEGGGQTIATDADPAAEIGRALVVATVRGPKAGLAMLESLQHEFDADYRLAAARAHLLEIAGHEWDAVAEYRNAAQHAPDHTEERYLLMQASRLTEQLERPL